jgi:hypothetical protein
MHEHTLAIAKSFVEARGNEVGRRLSRLFADNYFYVEEYEQAIRYYFDLIIDDENDSRHDYLLWMGQAFKELDLLQNARMCFSEILRAVGHNKDDDRAVRARQFLEEIAQAG